MAFNLDLLFQKSELIPVIIQEVDLTLETGTAWVWSRSRGELWNKGGTSGNFLHVKEIRTDCDTDTLLYLCRPDGPACHTGSRSCFFNTILEGTT